MSVIKFIPPVIAHRGASKLAPENTLAAFRKAKVYGTNWVEFDVMLTKCGEAVVIHDETVDRTTNGSGRVAELTYAEIKTLDAGSWFSPNFAGERIPTLKEVILLLNELQLLANIEIKPCAGFETPTVKKVLQMVDQFWKQKNPPLISSFSREVLQDVHRFSPQSLLGFLMHDWEDDWREASDRLSCVSVHVYESLLTSERIGELKTSGRNLLSYTLDEVSRARELLDAGVDAVFSNCPVDFLRDLDL